MKVSKWWQNVHFWVNKIKYEWMQLTSLQTEAVHSYQLFIFIYIYKKNFYIIAVLGTVNIEKIFSTEQKC